MPAKKTAKHTTSTRRKVVTASKKTSSYVSPFNLKKLLPALFGISFLFLFFAVLASVVGIKNKWLSSQEINADPEVMVVTGEALNPGGSGFWGYIFKDTNRNGVFDTGESPLLRGSVTVEVDDTYLPIKPVVIRPNSRGFFSWDPPEYGRYKLYCNKVMTTSSPNPSCTTNPNFCKVQTYDYQGVDIQGNCGWSGVR